MSLKWVLTFGSDFDGDYHELEPAQVGFCSKETGLRRFFLTSGMTRGAEVCASLYEADVVYPRLEFIPFPD